MSKKIYVHVADDHKIIIDGIIAVINTEEDIEVTGYSLTGKQVVDWFSNRKNKADVLVLDINIPGLDGFDVVKKLNKNIRKPKIIIVSSYNDIRIVEEMLDLGCCGYITKNNAGVHIAEAIKTVVDGEQYFSNDIQKALLKRMAGNEDIEGEAPDSFLLETLTDRELDVLKLILKEYNTPEIAEKLNLGTSTIITYRKSLLKKLKVKNVVGLAMYAMRNKII